MSRYQIYLEPNTVSIIDDLSSSVGVSRSQVIRDVIDRIAREYKKVLTVTAKSRLKQNPLLKMIGSGHSSSNNLSRTVDIIYSRG